MAIAYYFKGHFYWYLTWFNTETTEGMAKY